MAVFSISSAYVANRRLYGQFGLRCPVNIGMSCQHKRDQIFNDYLIQACRIILNMQRLGLDGSSQSASPPETRTPISELTQIIESGDQGDSRAFTGSDDDLT